MDSLRADLATEVERVADRLRSMSQAKLVGSLAGSSGHRNRAAAARETAQALADAAARLDAGRATNSVGVSGRALPVLSEFAAGDQIAVTGHDLIAAIDRTPSGDLEPAARQLIAEALERLRTLRRLP